jgi:hypothetical protein
MLTHYPIGHNRGLDEIARHFQLQGYRVTVEPEGPQLPEFLRPFRPDLIAEGPDESVVVKVRSGSRMESTSDWEELARRVQENPGWRFEIVAGVDLGRLPMRRLERAAIQRRLEDAQELVHLGKLEAALLLVWSAVEAGLRLLEEQTGADVRDGRTQAIIARLYMDGLLERTDYETLLTSLEVRNAVAHGLQKDDVSASLIQSLQSLAERLLSVDPAKA